MRICYMLLWVQKHTNQALTYVKECRSSTLQNYGRVMFEDTTSHDAINNYVFIYFYIRS